MTPPSVETTSTLVLLDVELTELRAALDQAAESLAAHRGLEGESLQRVREALARRSESGPNERRDHVAIVHERVDGLANSLQVLLRFRDPIGAQGATEPTRFLWVLLSDRATHPSMDTAAEFAHLLLEREFLEQAIAATDSDELEQAYRDALSRDVHPAEHQIPPELRRTGRLFGGMLGDAKRRLPWYRSDFTDGFNTKTLASVFFLFFACLAPAVAFGGLLAVLTDGEIGALEMIVATTLCGSVYALVAGQPLTLLGSTGPVIIFIGILYSLCERLGIPFMPTLTWVGLWTSGFLLILAATDASSLIRYFTRFTDETFAALISVIFIVEALKDMVGVFTSQEVSHSTALLSTILALGTYQIALNLSRARRSVYLLRSMREFLADFGPTIAIVLMTAVAFSLHEVEIQTLAVPLEFRPTSERAWFVNPLDAPTWVWGAAALPALLVSILLYLDQNITVRLVNNPEYKLKKGAGYHLDLAVVGVLVGVCSLFGLPWMVAATVRSLNHVRSLAHTETLADSHGTPTERVISVVETRVSAFTVHALIGGSLLVLPLLSLVPMSVLFGLFLFMGVASMAGNQFFERLKLWARDPGLYPPTYYLRAVPTGTVHRYTGIQFVCFGVLWFVKSSVFGILFPLFIALLVPVRLMLERLFKPEYLALLDAEGDPTEAEDRQVGL